MTDAAGVLTVTVRRNPNVWTVLGPGARRNGEVRPAGSRRRWRRQEREGSMRIPMLCALVLAAACGPTEEEIQQARCAGERTYRDMTKDELEDERTRIMKLEMVAIVGARRISRAVPTTLKPPKVEAQLEKFARDKEEAERATAAFRLEEECRRAAAEAEVAAEVEEIRGRAERGDAVEQFSLGRMYFAGIGVEQDDREAVRWYRLAAGQGYAGAQLALGRMYAEGRGVARDDREAVRWYRLAADHPGVQPAAQAALERLEEAR